LTKKSKIGTVAVFLALGLLSYYLIVKKLINYSNWNDFLHIFTHSPLKLALFVAVQMLLGAFNLYLETIKWHWLIGTTHRQSFRISIQQTMAGLAWGNLTPARIGEPVGKAFHLPLHTKVQAVALSLLGSIVQNIIIAIVGMAALGIAFSNQNITAIKTNVSHGTLTIAFLATVAITMFAGLLWAKTFVKYLVRRLKLHRIIIALTPMRLTKIATATILRYTCFWLQLAIALMFFAAPINFVNIIMFVPLYLLAITLVPSFLLADVGIKGSVALMVFGLITTNTPAIVSTIFAIWVINTALPTIGGLITTANMNKK
jgi:hypothetical protein